MKTYYAAVCVALTFILEMDVLKCQEPAKLLVGVRDTVLGKSIPNIPAELYKEGQENEWTLITETVSSETGSIQFELSEELFTRGIYRLVYYLEDYYSSQNLTSFYPYTEVVFEKESDTNEEITIPLLASPYGYTAYKGSAAK